MLSSRVPASEKRAAWRRSWRSGSIQLFPGAFNPLSARLVQDKAFDGVYISGAALSADLGLPDIGLTTATEVARRTQEIAGAVDLPVLVDADTGFGEPMSAARTTQALEAAGAAGLQIEDQVNPKRCGHLDGKAIVDVDVAARRVRACVDARTDPNFAVVARTDARGLESLDSAVARALAYIDAGADMIFPEALTTLDEYATFRRAVDVPIVANMTEFGKTPLFSRRELEDVGVDVVLYPVSLFRLAMGAVEDGLDVLRGEGSLASRVGLMQTRARLYELLDYESYGTFDAGIYNFGSD